MVYDMDKDLDELHNLTNTAFQNVSNLSPALRHLVANAKIYQKSVQTTCNLAVMFVESFQQVANAAAASEGSTKKLGDVLADVIDAFKEIENMKLELMKLFINEIIIPLESKAENEISLTKSTHKSYNNENKIQAELTEKAISGAAKYRKKMDEYRKKMEKKKKPNPKLEEKEKTAVQLLDDEMSKLKKVREEGLRKALIEERRMYCFVAERMCSYGRGMVVYNNRISNFVSQKLPDWQQFISKPTELPQESEDIIKNPTGYKMGTVKSKISKSEKRESLKRGKSFNNHFPTKYSTIDGRSSRSSSRPTLSINSSRASLTTASPNSRTPSTPSTLAGSPKFTSTTSKDVNQNNASPVSDIKENGFHSHDEFDEDEEDEIVDAQQDALAASDKEKPPVGLYVMPLEGADGQTPSPVHTPSDYANILVVPNGQDEKQDTGLSNRSLSFSGPIQKPARHRFDQTCRSESDEAADGRRGSAGPPVAAKPKSPTIEEQNEPHFPNGEGESFSSKLAMIQNQLQVKMGEKPKSTMNGHTRYLKALYKHEAQDASQLSFDKDDVIIPVCDPTSGWQYGENEKTEKSGWFPAAFTEEVLVTKTGTKEGKSSNTHSARKPPPVLAKKAAIMKQNAANRKISVGSTSLVHPSKTSADLIRRGSHGDIPRIPTSTSVPEMMQNLGNGDVQESNHQRKLSNSLNGIDQTAHHDTHASEPETPAPAPEDAHQQFVNGEHYIPPDYDQDDDEDAMPPPPPPPPIWDEETEGGTSMVNGNAGSDPFDGISMKQQPQVAT
ncbi:BAR/IMD domain-containing adapter protein 2-like [Clytia hemisphaerica]|uniref:SH3 domain-containing protein n=1 Tax=Clytia hemisphaerica TaxID=252671 RepID=A0A7M5X455_9CNID|eukprot:TCONS_00004424-protein